MKKVRVIFLGLILILVIKFNLDWYQAVDFKIVFFDVGQGDATLVTDSLATQVLIDGGPNEIILEKLGEQMPFWDKTIELIILTHPDQDHLFGLNSVLANYKVEKVLMTGVSKDVSGYEEFKKILDNKEIEVIWPAEQNIYLAEDFYLEILYPDQDLQNKEVANVNNTSIVVRLVAPEKAVLLTGDLETKGELELISNKEYIKSSVLKLGHHGSKTSSSQSFLWAVQPEIVIVSAGRDNRYQHPHQEVLDRLKDRQILQTSLQGDIEIDL